MPEFSYQTAAGLLRALQRQFADLSNLATGKAVELPDTSFTHYRKLGEAAGLHTAWRMVADLADQVAEGFNTADHPGETLPDSVTRVHPDTKDQKGN